VKWRQPFHWCTWWLQRLLLPAWGCGVPVQEEAEAVQRVGTLPGKRTRTGDCRFILDDQCSIVFNTGGVTDGDTCTRDWCSWHGNVNSVRGCTPFPTCFFRSGLCMHTKIAGCGKKPKDQGHKDKSTGGQEKKDEPEEKKEDKKDDSPKIETKVESKHEDGRNKGQGQGQPQHQDSNKHDDSAKKPAPQPENHGSSNNAGSEHNDGGSQRSNSQTSHTALRSFTSSSSPSSSSYSSPKSSLPAYNVLDHGAKGDGSSWDTQAIQRLMLQVCAEGRGDNRRRTVLFPGGPHLPHRPHHPRL